MRDLVGQPVVARKEKYLPCCGQLGKESAGGLTTGEIPVYEYFIQKKWKSVTRRIEMVCESEAEREIDLIQRSATEWPAYLES